MAGGSRAIEGNGRFAETASATHRKAGRMTANNMFNYEILEGPSLERVIDALKYAFTPGAKLRVNFLVRSTGGDRSLAFGRNLEAQVVGVSYESNSAGMFILTVNIDGYSTSQGFYNACTREGWLNLERSASRVRYSPRP